MAAPPPLFPDRDLWAEREREMERREKARAEREWDRDKVREFGRATDEKEGGPRRSRSRDRRRKERGKSKEKKAEKKGGRHRRVTLSSVRSLMTPPPVLTRRFCRESRRTTCPAAG